MESPWFLTFGLASAALLALLVINRLIRVALAAPRVVEKGVPEGLPWREVSIPTVRGKRLFGWFIPAADGAPALAVLHGWGGNAEMMLPLARPLFDAGYSLLFFDARCHGKSDGDSFASLPRFAEDLEHAVDWLQQQSSVKNRAVGVIAHSVGAGAALLLASRRRDLAAVVSLAAFAHPTSMMRRWLALKRIPYWPVGAYILFYVQRVIGYRFDVIAPRHTIRSVTCPVLLAHGMEDDMVPVSEAKEIHANRPDERVRLLLLPGGHDDYGELDQPVGQVIQFLDEAFQSGTRNPPGSQIRDDLRTDVVGKGAMATPESWRHRLARRLGGQAVSDPRGGKVVAVIHCILNQNVRDRGAAVFADANLAVLGLCGKHGVGLLQMPCPEMAFLGMARQRPAGTSLREALDTLEGRKACRHLAAEMRQQIEAHLAQGCRVLAVVGGNPQSPGCAVHLDAVGLARDAGVFLQELQDELRRRHIDVPFLPMRDANADSLERDLAALEALFILKKAVD